MKDKEQKGFCEQRFSCSFGLVLDFPIPPLFGLGEVRTPGGFLPSGHRDPHHRVQPDHSYSIIRFRPGTTEETAKGFARFLQGIFLCPIDAPLWIPDDNPWFLDRYAPVPFPCSEVWRRARLEDHPYFRISSNDDQLSLV